MDEEASNLIISKYALTQTFNLLTSMFPSATLEDENPDIETRVFEVYGKRYLAGLLNLSSSYVRTLRLEPLDKARMCMVQADDKYGVYFVDFSRPEQPSFHKDVMEHLREELPVLSPLKHPSSGRPVYESESERVFSVERDD